MLLIETRAFLVNYKNCEAIIITIHKDSIWDFNTYELGYICDFLSLKKHLLNNMILVMLVKVPDIEALLSEDVISKLSESLM